MISSSFEKKTNNNSLLKKNIKCATYTIVHNICFILSDTRTWHTCSELKRIIADDFLLV